METIADGSASNLQSVSDPAFDRDTFLLQKRLLTLSEEYDICDEDGNPILYVQRPVHQALGCLALVAALFAFFVVLAVVMITVTMLAPRSTSSFVLAFAFPFGAVAAVLAAIAMRPKRHATFYRDASKGEIVLRVKQDRRFQPIVARYTVLDTAGRPLAKFYKNHLHNFFRKRWECFAVDGKLLCVALEQAHMALVRQTLERVFSNVATNFSILRRDSDVAIGEFNRKATILSHHALDLKADSARSLDRRIALALGVMLDSGERGE